MSFASLFTSRVYQREFEYHSAVVLYNGHEHLPGLMARVKATRPRVFTYLLQH